MTTTAALSTPKDYALCYQDMGFSLFVLRNPETGTPVQLETRKRPAVNWDVFQIMRPSKIQIDRWFAKNPNYNLAIVTGSISKIVALDVDGPTAYNRLEEKKAEMSTNLFTAFMNTMVNRTGSGGLHIVFRIEDPIDDISQITIWEDGQEHSEIKLQGNGHYIVAAPSVHPNNKSYEWNGKHPDLITRQELNELIRLLSNRAVTSSSLQSSRPQQEVTTLALNEAREQERTLTHEPLSAQKIQGLLAALKPRYTRGRRHKITLGYSGFMRKRGYSLRAVEEFCVIVCQTFNDEEFESRLRDVKDTFSKPMNTGREIAGWSLLNDLS